MIIAATALVSACNLGPQPAQHPQIASRATHRREVAEPAQRLEMLETAGVVDTAQALLDAMAARDALKLRQLLVSTVTFISTDERKANPVPRTTGLEDFVESVRSAKNILHERIHDPTVHVDGNVAMLWAPYTFHVGDRFSHCGYDAFLFVRREGAWRITSVSYTLRPQEQCGG